MLFFKKCSNLMKNDKPNVLLTSAKRSLYRLIRVLRLLYCDL
jgi:hypothetical protein